MSTWIVVADAASARVFEVATPIAPLTEVARMGHPSSRANARELVTDRPGRGHVPASSGRHGMTPPSDPTEVETERFAAELAGFLRQRRLAGAYDRLHLVAAPAFLGLLRKALDEGTRGQVVTELNKDLARVPSHELRSHLPERL